MSIIRKGKPNCLIQELKVIYGVWLELSILSETDPYDTEHQRAVPSASP